MSDANLVLGYLNPDGLVGGRLPLDAAKAHAAIRPPCRAPEDERGTRRLWHVHHRQRQHGERHPPGDGRRGYDRATSCWSARAGATAAISPRWPMPSGSTPSFCRNLPRAVAFGQIISDVKYNYMATAPLRLDNDAPMPASTNGSARSKRKASATEVRWLQGPRHRGQAQPWT